MARAYLASAGPFRETNAKSDERASRDALEPASRALDEPAETVDREGVERQPYEAEPRMDPGEEQRLRQHAVTRRDELWEEREIEERDLRVQHVGEEALRERASRLGPPRCRGRAEVAAEGIAQRSDAEVREIPGARDLHHREGLGRRREDDREPERRRGRVDRQAGRDAKAREERGAPTLVQRDLRDERHICAGKDRQERDDPREREQRAVDRHDRAAGSPVRKKASTRRHASSQAALWSANVRSKKECGAPGYTSR